MFENSISGNKWYHGKTPKLQINILKQIITSGKVSKTLATKLLGANYPDISNSIDALAKLEFIKISGKKLTTGRNYEIFYKITEKGLQGLMEIKLDKYEFWKVIILLCMISNRPLDEQELEYYFNKYEHGILSHHSAFSLTHLFDNIIYNLMNSYGKHKAIPPSQKVLECLALNGPSNINKLSKKTCMTEEEINRIMGNILVRRKIPTENSNDDSLLKHTTHSTNNNKKKINSLYSDQVLQALILENETKDGEIYELTLLGIMTVLAIITYHFAGMDDIRFPAGISSVSGKRPRLFYSSINPRKYFDAIALNYRNKIPLIFGKWDLLISQLGTMLYDSFDFLIYKANRLRTINESIWSGGTSEFYNDLQVSSLKAIRNLYPIFMTGNTVIKEFERHQIWLANDSRMVPIYNKLIEIESQLIYANILDQSYPRVGVPNSDEIKIIENLFKDEITFLFYMSLDTQFVITRSYKYRSHGTKSLEDKLIEMPSDLREAYDLGSPQERLMAIFSKDSDIKNWFSVWIADIIEYRKETSKIMSDFYDQIMNLNIKRKSNQRPSKGIIIHSTPEGIRTKVLHEEYNITKICIN